MKDQKFLGKIGGGSSVHTIIESFSETHQENFLWTACGSDHRTNRHTTVKKIGEFNPSKVTCSKCLNRIENEKATENQNRAKAQESEATMSSKQKFVLEQSIKYVQDVIKDLQKVVDNLDLLAGEQRGSNEVSEPAEKVTKPTKAPKAKAEKKAGNNPKKGVIPPALAAYHAKLRAAKEVKAAAAPKKEKKAAVKKTKDQQFIAAGIEAVDQMVKSEPVQHGGDTLEVKGITERIHKLMKGMGA